MGESSDPVRRFREAQAALVRLSGDERRAAARMIFRDRDNVARSHAAKVILALVSEHGGDEWLAWFWFNHFNVFWRKGGVGAALPSYLEHAIYPHVRDKFRDLLLAVVTHPALLLYLDNAANSVGRINENLARELLELHTLGIDGGYTEADVRAVARVLTGFGLTPLEQAHLPPRSKALVVQHGEFTFDPLRHDFEPKHVLGRTIPGSGFGEVEVLVDLLAAHPATARHAASKLCQFIAGDAAAPILVNEAALVFAESNGDLGRVVAHIRERAARVPSVEPRTFKDPMRWVISSVRLLSGGRPLGDAQPLLRWLAALGQPLFGCSTPDGYSLRGADWVSAGQLVQRFEIAREMVAIYPRLFDDHTPLPDLWRSPAVRDVSERVGKTTADSLQRSSNLRERTALLLSSPEFMVW